MVDKRDIIIIGGGAAGFFAAINAKTINPDLKITILEQGQGVLKKVKISGGGRCNVTHHCFDPKELTQYYPRGHKELKGPFHTFGAQHTVDWFESRGIKLYTEPDGCMFPVANDSEVFIQCFLNESKKYGIEILTSQKVKSILPKDTNGYTLQTDNTTYETTKLMIATGSVPSMWSILETIGYKIVPPVPSLFTFNMPKNPITALMGIVVSDAEVKIKNTNIVTNGPLLITHWGLSGPAILKASAWGATILAERNYIFDIEVDWIPHVSEDNIRNQREVMNKKKVLSNNLFGLSIRLWKHLIEDVITDTEKNWASLTKIEMNSIVSQLKRCSFNISGKTTFKEEFVTAGGVELSQINFKTFESRLHPGIYMAGEVLNIDAVTGGFNFQAAWTGGYIAGLNMAQSGTSVRK